MTESMIHTGSPWVYLFSRFTSEALLFEALIIFTLCALYAAFWLLRKRKYGVVEQQVPAGVVKYYLNELIVDAEQLRAQLFGLLSGQGIAATPLANLQLGTGATANPAAGMAAPGGDPQSMASLETKLAAQAKQIETFISDKTRIEQELSAARAAKGGAAAGGDAGAIAKLQEKIAQLEGKLAEYSVIEDDLANLKRLQQENTALKGQLAAKGMTPALGAGAVEAASEISSAIPTQTPATTTPVAATLAPAEAAPPVAAAGELSGAGVDAGSGAATASESTATQGLAAEAQARAVAQSSPLPPETRAQTATATPSTAAKAEGAGAAGKSASQATPTAPGASGLGAAIAQAQAGAPVEGGFESLVDQVEQSLQPRAGAAQPTEAAATTSSTMPNPATTIEKSDADLVAEFEKMLNG